MIIIYYYYQRKCLQSYTSSHCGGWEPIEYCRKGWKWFGLDGTPSACCKTVEGIFAGTLLDSLRSSFLCLIELCHYSWRTEELKCFRRLLPIFYGEHKTNQFVRNAVATLVGPKEPLFATVKRRQLAQSRATWREDKVKRQSTRGPTHRYLPENTSSYK